MIPQNHPLDSLKTQKKDRLAAAHLGNGQLVVGQIAPGEIGSQAFQDV